MAHSLNLMQRNDSTLWWALLSSFALHALLVWVLPNIQIEPEPPEAILLVNLAAPLPTTKSVTVRPEAKPEPKQTEAVNTEKPPPRPQEQKPKLPPLPSPIAEAPPVESPAAENKPQAPAVMTTEAKTEAKPMAAPSPPTPVAPAPEQPKPASVSQPDLDAARDQYGNMLAREIAKYKQYPRIAQSRGYQGEVILELHLDGSGRVLDIKVKQSSTYDVLDKQALEMIKKASPFPLPPDTLRNREFKIIVPIPFQLESN